MKPHSMRMLPRLLTPLLMVEVASRPMLPRLDNVPFASPLLPPPPPPPLARMSEARLLSVEPEAFVGEAKGEAMVDAYGDGAGEAEIDALELELELEPEALVVIAKSCSWACSLASTAGSRPGTRDGVVRCAWTTFGAESNEPVPA